MSRRTRKNIGLIGLGLIGDRVRDVLRRKGFQVFVWNRTPRPVPNFVGAPAELAEMCDFIQVFVSDDDALLYVVKQLSPALSSRHIVIAHSTVSPHTMVASGEIVERRGARFIEAPFTGSKEAAEKGELVYYVGGDPEALREARPLLQATSKDILEMGEIGQATAIKVATNMITAATVQATAEALALVQSVGLAPEQFAKAIEQNASYSKTLAMKLPKMIGRNFERHFSVQHMSKDMQIASRLGLSHHLELGVTAAARDRLLEQMQHGHGDEDYSAVARKYWTDAKPTAETDLELFQGRPNEAKPEPDGKTPAQPEFTASAPEAVATPMASSGPSLPQQGAPVPPLQPAAVEAVAEANAMPGTEPARPIEAVSHIEPQQAEAVPQPSPAAPSPEAPAKTEPHAGSPEEPVVTRALQTLEAHVPAAPFLNPVESGQPSATEPEPQPAASVAIDNPPDFLSQPAQPVAEDEGENARGFFSRLLRRANS